MALLALRKAEDELRREEKLDDMHGAGVRRSTRHREQRNTVHRHFVSALIEYPPHFFGRSAAAGSEMEASEIDKLRWGLLVYAKPSFSGDESADLQQFRALHPDFPHQTTAEQNYEPDQFEAYRQLGQHVGQDVSRLFLAEEVEDHHETKAGINGWFEDDQRLRDDLWARELKSVEELIQRVVNISELVPVGAGPEIDGGPDLGSDGHAGAAPKPR